MKDGDCIGGFTTVSWSSPAEGEWVSDSNAMVFNLTQGTFFPCKNESRAIRVDKKTGPTFGKCEL